MLNNAEVPVLGFVAPSGTGKTTLLKKLIPLLKAEGIRLAVIKHAHHRIEIDHPGKDSYVLRHAGADQVLLASHKGWALMVETPENQTDVELDEMIGHLNQDALDLIIVEGFKHGHFPKIELFRQELKKPALFPTDNNIIAVASSSPLATTGGVKNLDLNQEIDILHFIQKKLALPASQKASLTQAR
ncbi:MAG: molybdopterin-guanine dinucleotide biosynthesis protein B [Gammaproteobacteria bacterium]|nr:molybdopterin-guanine dinucleotide biosynthesis protein B [Gammaproteobacteria bacterium]